MDSQLDTIPEKGRIIRKKYNIKRYQRSLKWAYYDHETNGKPDYRRPTCYTDDMEQTIWNLTRRYKNMGRAGAIELLASINNHIYDED